MIRPKVTHPSAETTRVRVPLADSHSEEALAESLAALVTLTADLEPLIRNSKEHAKDSKYASYLVTTFSTPGKRFINERVFFARCAKHPKLHEAMLTYARNVNSRARRIKGMETDLGHSDMRPAGCFAIVPLALRAPQYIGALIEHLRGTDMDHETFHASLIEELLVRHGLIDQTLELLAWRAVDGAGQEGESNLKLAYAKHGLRDRLATPDGLEAFAMLTERISFERKPGPAVATRGYRELYVSNAGKALFQGDEARFNAWLDSFRARGLEFDATETTLPPKTEPYAPADFAEEWVSED